jgi:hypothetical protein
MNFIDKMLGIKEKDPLVIAAFQGIASALNQFVTPGKKLNGPLKTGQWEYLGDINDPTTVRRRLITEVDDSEIYLVHYPKNSKLYDDPIKDKFKKCTILQGKIKDVSTGKEYREGDPEIIVRPIDTFIAKTDEKNECLVMVQIKDRMPVATFINRKC